MTTILETIRIFVMSSQSSRILLFLSGEQLALSLNRQLLRQAWAEVIKQELQCKRLLRKCEQILRTHLMFLQRKDHLTHHSHPQLRVSQGKQIYAKSNSRRAETIVQDLWDAFDAQ